MNVLPLKLLSCLSCRIGHKWLALYIVSWNGNIDAFSIDNIITKYHVAVLTLATLLCLQNISSFVLETEQEEFTE